jgi:hypothetical protein
VEREKIIFLRNFFFRAFIIGVAFALFFLIVTYAFWNTWASWVTSWTKVDEKDLGRLTAQRPTPNAQRSTLNVLWCA